MKSKKTDKEYTVIAYIFIAIFMMMILYLVYFTLFEKDRVLNNPYNKRIEAMKDTNTRGKIYANDGVTILAQTVTEDGEEVREYPYGNMFAHVIGTSEFGQMGIEKLANYYLLNSNANPVEMIKDELTGNKKQGDSVVTTLDFDLQKAAYDAMRNNKGAVVVMEPSTGKILTLLSKPDFDPNLLEYSWDILISYDSKDTVLYNRATQGLYPPGSTFKVVTLLEYMRENPDSYLEFSYTCTGKITQNNFTMQCFNGTAHNTQDLEHAFSNSCNSAFATIGLQLNVEKLNETCNSLLFNTELPFALEYNSSRFDLSQEDGDAQIMMTAIGQGNTLMSPLHNAFLACAIANDGVLMQPYLVDRVLNEDGMVVKKYEPEEYIQMMTVEEAEVLTQYMRTVVTEGTGNKLTSAEYEAAGKTGSAQYDNSDNVHSWFIGFAPADNPQIAICVVLEGGYTGVDNAQEVARQIMDNYFINHNVAGNDFSE